MFFQKKFKKKKQRAGGGGAGEYNILYMRFAIYGLRLPCSVKRKTNIAVCGCQLLTLIY